MLMQWKQTKARDATYGALVKVLRDLENNATADRVEELERKARTSQGNIKLAHQHSILTTYIYICLFQFSFPNKPCFLIYHIHHFL